MQPEVDLVVTCPNCRKQFGEDDMQVEFLGIEENLLGEDVVTFECPGCGEVIKSLVTSRGAT